MEKHHEKGKGVLLLVICNSVKMGIHLCYKWDKPKEMVKVEKYLCVFNKMSLGLFSQLKSWINSIHLFKSV